MRFNEKLQHLRKEKKLSQEQLADMLDVTRQSVSKWESGTTYPEMDKLIMLCKIFEVSLDDLTNDDISEISISKKEAANSFSLNNILDSFFGFIGKTVRMFQAMSFKEIVKCIFTMLIFSLFLLIIRLPFEAIESGFHSIFSRFDLSSWYAIYGIFEFILNSIFIIVYVVVLVYVFKIAYLDKYEFVSSKKIVKEEAQISDEVETAKEVRIVEVEKPRDNTILKVLGGIVLGFIKFLFACFSLPIMFIFVILCFLLVVDLYFMFDGVVFVGVFLGLIFAIVLCAWFIEAISIFIFNRKIPFKRLIITFLVGLAGLGVSLGICLFEIYEVNYIDEVPSIEDVSLTTKKDVIPMNDALYIAGYYGYYDGYYTSIEYIEDEAMTNEVEIELSFYKDIVDYDYEVVDNSIIFHRYYVDNYNVKKMLFKTAKKDLEKKRVYNYGKLYENRLIIRSSKENILKIKDNTYKKNRSYEVEYQNSISSYEVRISGYERDIEEYENRIDELLDKNEKLQEKIDDLEDYKTRVQGILGE